MKIYENVYIVGSNPDRKRTYRREYPTKAEALRKGEQITANYLLNYDITCDTWVYEIADHTKPNERKLIATF